MTKRLEVYKCDVCGNIIEVVHASGGELVCCARKMILLEEKKEDQGMEKHLPVIETTDGGLKVIVGSVTHPMEENHFIEWIELVTDIATHIVFLKPGQAPEALFCDCTGEKIIAVREHCTIHGLWMTTI